MIPEIYLIDLFCGAGGVTTGFDGARHEGNAVEVGQARAIAQALYAALVDEWQNIKREAA